MKLIDKDKGGEPVHLPWDAAQAALASGGYDAHPIDGERDIDQPAAQSPAPGTEPKDPSRTRDEQALPNLTAVASPARVPSGLPKEIKTDEPVSKVSGPDPKPAPAKP